MGLACKEQQIKKKKLAVVVKERPEATCCILIELVNS
jgi:hypothetical protein